MRGDVTVLRMIFEYYGHWLWIVVLCLSLVYIVAIAKGKERLIIVVSIVFFCLFILNPYIINLLKSREEAVFYRFLWITSLPIVFSVAYFKLISKYNRPLVVFIPMICIFLISQYTGLNVTKYGMGTFVNRYNIDDDVIVLSDIIDEYEEGEKVRVIMPSNVQLEMRLYNPKVVSAISRSTYLKYEKGTLTKKRSLALISLTKQAQEVSAKKMSKYIEKSKAQYIILPIHSDRDYLSDAGCILLAQSQFFEVYRVGIDYEYDEYGEVIEKTYVDGIWNE